MFYVFAMGFLKVHKKFTIHKFTYLLQIKPSCAKMKIGNLKI